MPDEEEQIEEWFEKEKERIEDKYFKILEKTKNHKKVRNDMDEEMKKILAEYEKRYDNLWNSQERREKLMKPVNYLKKKKKKLKKTLKHKYKNSKLWMKETMEELKKQYGEKKSQVDLKIHRLKQKFRKKL